MRVGVLGTGHVVYKITKTLKAMEGVECYAIASRTMERAIEAAKEFGYERAYGTYEELVQDEAVELVYIATPHSRHYEDMVLCIEHGKPVLCEKAFTFNAAQAREIERMSKERGVYVAEAIWTRYMPSRQIINELLDKGTIGRVSTMTANLSYAVCHRERLKRPELAGGALLDVGVYGLNFATMHMGKDIERIDTSVQMLDTGVDGGETITIHYRDGRMAVLTHSICVRSDRRGIFHGERGYMIVDNINNPLSIDVYDLSDQLVSHIDVPEQISGYEYQFMEAMDRIAAGERESVSIPLSESVYIMELADAIRKQWGLVYPQERLSK